MSTPDSVPTPASFRHLGLSSELVQVIESLGYNTMTPIQEQSIPALLKGRDVIGQSKTGSGKTAAFAIPMLHKINAEQRSMQALVMCPTRELCTQVSRSIRQLGRHLPGLHVLVASGGQPIGPQVSALEKGVHIAVGTPGRILDLKSRGLFPMHRIEMVVLDEADRMLDMGFQEDMEKILRSLPPKHQTILFSATFPPTIEDISTQYQNKPLRITVEASPDESPAIEEFFYAVELEERSLVLRWLLQKHQPETGIIFCNFKAAAAELAEALTGSGISATAIHGDLEQFDRDKVMTKFRNRSIRLLVATDVAARGIDIEALDLVINYDMPQKPDVYVHRIGRTGRAGKKGLAFSLVTPKNRYRLDELNDYRHQHLTLSDLPDTEELRRDLREHPFSLPATMRTIYLSSGRKDKLRPGDILGALTGEAGGITAAHVGKIEIYDRFSYVAVASGVAEILVQRLREGKIKGRKINLNLEE